MVDGVTHLLHLINGHGQTHEQAPVQVLVYRPSQRLHPGKVPGGLDIIRQIDDLLQQRHIRLTGGVVHDRVIHIVVHGKHIPCDGRAGLTVQQLQCLLLQLIQRDAIVSAQRQLLVHIQLLVQSCSSAAMRAFVTSAP